LPQRNMNECISMSRDYRTSVTAEEWSGFISTSEGHTEKKSAHRFSTTEGWLNEVTVQIEISQWLRLWNHPRQTSEKFVQDQFRNISRKNTDLNVLIFVTAF
jgi:hypothetical protein